MRKGEDELRREYPDLLGDDADAGLVRLVAGLDMVSGDLPAPPPSVGAARERAIREYVARRSRPQRHWRLVGIPRRLPAVVASVLALLLVAGATYALVIPLVERAFRAHPGTERITVEGLAKRVNLSQTAGGFTMTLERLYADPNQVVLGYTVTGPAGSDFASFELPAASLTDRGGRQLEPLFGTGTPVEEGRSGHALRFDAAGVVSDQQELELHLSVPALEAIESTGARRTVRGPFEFDFRVPVYPGKVLEPDQSVESDGTTVTLERVVVTPVETRIILRGVGPNAAVTAEAGGSEYHLSPRGAVPLQWTPESAWSYSSPENLVNETDEWVVTVAPGPPVPPDVAPSVPVVTGGPWIFRFTLP